MSEKNAGAAAPTSGMAVAGLVLGILAVVSSWIPIINNLSFVIAAVGVVLSAIGLSGTLRGKKSGKGMAIAAVVVNVVAIVVVLGTQSAMSAAIDEATSGPAVSEISSSSNSDGANADDASQDATPQDGADAQTASLDLAPGASVTLESGLTVTVDSVETGLVNYDDSEIVGIQVTYANNGSEAADYNSYDWKGEDANGAQEYATFYSDGEEDLGSGSLAAGGTKTGWVYFEGGTVKALYFASMMSDEPTASWTIG